MMDNGKPLTKQDLIDVIGGLEQRFDGKLASFGSNFDTKMETLQSNIDKKLEALDKKLDALESNIDKKLEALESKFDNKLKALEINFDKKLDSLEDRLREYVHDTETKLLTAFHKYATANEERLGHLEDFSGRSTKRLAELEAAGRLSALELRVAEIEKRLDRRQ